jgi:hypothetical protein
MAEGRPDIPAEMKRAALVEAGHRCAIPTCRQWPVEICHIVDWAIVRKHEFDNLIALCPTCHTRQTRGEIDRKALLAYKHNLAVLNSRYSHYEQRVMRMFGEQPDRVYFTTSGGDDQTVQLQNLLTDGFLKEEELRGMNHILTSDDPEDPMELVMPATRLFTLTPAGRDYIRRWLAAEEIG